jgi:glutathione S-transferase
MKLYASYTSPFARHCRIALLQGNLECEFISTDHAQSAEKSVTKKVPFLEDQGLTLTDSSSILFHLAQKSGRPFIESAQDQELFSMANTCLDSIINVFLLENDGVTADTSGYIKRQQGRILSALEALNTQAATHSAPLNAAQMRVACLVDWALFRKRISIEGLTNLQALLDTARQDDHFNATAIPDA